MSASVEIPHASYEHELRHEERIVWLPGFDPRKWRYVREAVYPYADRRRGRLKWNGREVGWSELRSDAPRIRSCFWRRVFWLASHDPYEGRGGPIEAVDPLTVAPGKLGERNERALSGGGDGNTNTAGGTDTASSVTVTGVQKECTT